MAFLGDLFKPIFELLASLIAFYYGLVHSYALAIAMLTVSVMIVVFPLTQMSTRSMLEMQRIQPELKAIQNKFKSDKAKQSEEMTRFMKENKVSPAGGCLPMLLQFPLLFVMYDVIRGLTNKSPNGSSAPKYVGHTTLLYKNLIAGQGNMHSLGLNLGTAATHVHNGFLAALPYYLLVFLAIGLVFASTWQIYSKNPAAASANPQQQMIMKFTPLMFGVIYIGVPSGVNVYFIVSSLFRIVQQELMWRHDPVLRNHSIKARAKVEETKEAKAAGTYVEPPKTGFLEKMREQSEQAKKDRATRGGSAKGAKGAQSPRPSGGAPRRNNNKRKKRR